MMNMVGTMKVIDATKENLTLTMTKKNLKTFHQCTTKLVKIKNGLHQEKKDKDILICTKKNSEVHLK